MTGREILRHVAMCLDGFMPFRLDADGLLGIAAPPERATTGSRQLAQDQVV